MEAVKMIQALYGHTEKANETEDKSFFHVEPGTRCQCVQVTGVCGNEITDYGVMQSGYCESCWEPDIVEAHELYRALRSENHTRQEAIEIACIPAKDIAGKQSNATARVIVKARKKRHTHST